MQGYGVQSVDLDIDMIDAEDDPDILATEIGRLVQTDSDAKILPARQWLENFYYYAGIRDFGMAPGSGTVSGGSLFATMLQSSALTNLNQVKRKIPKLFKAVQLQAAEITRQRIAMKVWPLDDLEKEVKRAKLSNMILDASWDTDNEPDLNYEALLWALMTPIVFRVDSLDYSFDKSRLWPKTEVKQTIDPMTGEPIVRQSPIVDAQGQPILEQHPWNRTELVTAFRTIFNYSADRQGDLDFIGHVGLKRIGWIRENFDRSEDGYRPEAVARVNKGVWKFTSCMAMEYALKYMTFGAFRTYANTNAAMQPRGDYVTFVPVYFKPSPRWPSGREICVANGEVIYDGPSRMHRDVPLKWHPYSGLCYERVPGRLWGTTYAEKLVDIQRAYEQARTELDQLIRTFAKPKLTMPSNAKIDRDTINGHEQILRYNPFGVEGGKPAYLSPPAPPSTLVDDIELTSREFTESSGMTEIRMGIRPQGVTTYRGLEVLREEANNSSNNLIRMYEKFIQIGQDNKLYNIKRSLVYPNPDLVRSMRVFKKMSHYVTDVEIKEFTGEDLGGYVLIEPYSSIGKSRLAQQEKVMSMAQMGALGDVVGDPDLNQEFKRKMDVQGFDSTVNKQVSLARWENQVMMASEEEGQPQVPPVYDYHDDALHIREVEMLLLDPDIESKPLAKQALLSHRQWHQMQLAEKQQQQMVAAAQQAEMSGQMFPDEGKGGKTGGGQSGGQAGTVGSGRGDPGVLFGDSSGFAQAEGQETF